MSIVNIATIQIKVVNNKLENIKKASKYIKEVSAKGADIAVLPEMFNCPYNMDQFADYAEDENGPTYEILSYLASSNNVYIVGGSIPEIEDNKIYNSCYVFDRKGKKIYKHRKIHLFDIDIEGGQYFMESKTLTPGKELNIFETEFGKIGVLICYDFRFPELSRILVEKGAKIIIVPAAFNMTTGPAHWEILFRTRALDNQIYTIGVAPARDIYSCYTSYANSIIVSPWGDIVSRMNEEEGYCIKSIDLAYVDKIRTELPLLNHLRNDIYEIMHKDII